METCLRKFPLVSIRTNESWLLRAAYHAGHGDYEAAEAALGRAVLRATSNVHVRSALMNVSCSSISHYFGGWSKRMLSAGSGTEQGCVSARRPGSCT